MNNDRYYRGMFIAAALWNFVAAIVLFFFYDRIRLLSEMSPTNDPTNQHLFSVLVFVFGIGYFLLSRDLYNNRALIRIAIIGKLAVFVVMVYHAIVHDVPWLLAISTLVDVVFAALFTQFLIRYKPDRT